MPVSTLSAAVHITPVVFKTFVKHRKERQEREKKGQEAPQDDIFFDQAFNIVKAFIELGTKNTVESLQAFTNTHVPSPYWAAISPVCVPLTTCNEAADILIEWFGPDELKHVVGGERWWQVRGLDGVDCEWIAEREHLDNGDVFRGRNLKKEDEDILRMEKLESVLLYVHGGGYFWGSINTHRFQILRYAHKIRGRAFAVNYRKAPQYPWPCPLHDVLAAYLYLISPPPGSIHAPVSPSKIVLAGDSAGGGLCLAAMTVLRDLGITMPAGAVLISPWVDLTHSFPSIMNNVETDIIPPYGFLAKPSPLWPVKPQYESKSRVAPSGTNPPQKPGHADTLKPSEGLMQIRKEGLDVPHGGYSVETQEEMLEKYPDQSNPGKSDIDAAWRSPGDNDRMSSGTPPTPFGVDASTNIERSDMDNWRPKPPKVLMENPNAVPLELRSQIQVYALTEQLTHPLVSPALQGSLGGLPPLYILAGEGEVLRDEIVYLAHRAAHPSQYPARDGILQEWTRQKENAEKFTTPTKVHLQVFDGMCHVLTVFTFTKSARYAYRSIGEFVRHVTKGDQKDIERIPFPEFRWPLDKQIQKDIEKNSHLSGPSDPPERGRARDGADAGNLFERSEAIAVNGAVSHEPSIHEKQCKGHSPQDSRMVDINEVLMVRERVDIHARVRPMEPKEALPCLNIPLGKTGVIKESPVTRWHHGQEQWDREYRATAVRAIRKRAKYEAQAKTIISHALDQGLVHESFPETLKAEQPVVKKTGRPVNRKTSIGEIQEARRWGPLDLQAEGPPPSAIAARRDTIEALSLLKKSIYHTAPITHKTVPRLSATDAIRAVFNPHDNPNAPPQQSVSEQQVPAAPTAPMHGLRIWDKTLTYFSRKSTAKAANGIKSTVATIQTAS